MAAELVQCLDDGDSRRLDAKVSASRTQGVAPLAVFFDATETTASSLLRPFHDLEYRWDFGDPDAGFWSSGASLTQAERNRATGAVAAHVYERPGSYQIAVTVGDYDGIFVRRCLQVKVYDPDAFFAGERTTCLSVDGNFTGCPEGARHVSNTDGDFAAAMRDHGGPSHRLLLRRGETWKARGTAIIRSNGPGILGAFGPGPRPRIQASADSGIPILQISSPSSPELRDWRIMDIEIDGMGYRGRTAIKAEGGVDQLTLLRLGLARVQTGVLFSSSVLDWHNRTLASSGHHLWDQLAIVETTTSEIIGFSGAYSAYVSATRLMMLGNNFDNGGGGEHTVRLPSVVAGVVGHNSFRGQGRAVGGKHAFTLRAAIHGGGGVTGGRDTQWIIVSDNLFHGADGSDWTVTYQPQAPVDERVVDVVTERNRFIAGAGTRFALVLFARRQTVRNNLFDLTGINSPGGILIHDGMTVGSTDLTVSHNSFIATDAGKNFVAIHALPAAKRVIATNNLAYAPRRMRARMFAGPGKSIANSTDLQVRRTDPRFISNDLKTIAGWKPLPSSYAIGAGAAASVWSDYSAKQRPGSPRHLGAVLP